MTASPKTKVEVSIDLEDLIPRFLANRERDIKAMTAAVAGGDYETVRILGHSMKGCGAGYGFQEVTTIGGQLEEAAIRRDGEAIRRGIEALAAYLDSIEVVFVDEPA